MHWNLPWACGSAPLGDGSANASAFAPAHPPIPTHEYERPELLAMEKESIGLFITEHPLKRVREALRLKADCTCAQVVDQRDADWVKVGGMITESKKIRTRAGTPMMFATLDDLDGSIEIVVFEKAISNIQEAKSRGGRVIVVTNASKRRAFDEIVDASKDVVLDVPDAHPLMLPLLLVIPLQLLAYHVAVRRGCDVDQPRNLAKSVTVE